MRKNWILSWVLSAALVGLIGGASRSAAQSGWPNPSSELAALQHRAPQPPKESWTKKVTGWFGGKSKQPIGPNVPTSGTKHDPISLGYASGPPNADLYFSMAKMSDQGGNTEHARSMYHRGLTMQPNNLDGMLALARLEDREGQLDAALHYYKQAVQLHPKSAKALNDLSLCFARRNQLTEALPPLEQAIRLEPGKQLYRNNIAKVLLELNQVNAALQHQSAVHPPAIAQYNIGYLLHQRGRNDEALPFLAAASKTDPSLLTANALMAQLSGGAQQVAQSPVTSDSVLPTPQSTPAHPYPTTGMGAISASPAFPTKMPAETARVPVGYSPELVPPVR